MTVTKPPGRYYSLKELAEAMGVSYGTMRRWRLVGKLPKESAKVGPSPVWTGPVIEAWLAAGRPADLRRQPRKIGNG